MSITKGPAIPWDLASFNWDSTGGITEIGQPAPTIKNLPYTWDDVYFVRYITGYTDHGLDYLEKHPEEKKKFIQLLCKVQGQDYLQRKQVKKTKIFIQDIALVAREVAGIDLKIEL